jgi:predicted dienelactone hydrolase
VLAGPARWPVVLFSPGNTVPRSIYTTFVEDLASHGFVVVAIDHPYSVAIVVLPDGRTAIQAGSGAPVVPFETRVGVHAADLRFALDEMTRLDSAPTT